MRKVTSGNFQTIWNNISDMIAMADLWTITTITGETFRWTSSDIPITVGGYTYTCSPLIKRGSTKSTSTLEVDSLEVTIETGESVTLTGIPFAHAAANGALDGATVKLERAFMLTWGVVTATVHLFEGRVAAINPTHTAVVIQVKSFLEVLDSQWPRNIYQPACCHQLYNTGCGISRSAYQVTGTATGGTTTKINWNTGKAAGYFDQGVIVITSGSNSGARRTIKSSDTTGLTIALPLPFSITSGTTFQVVPGCDKTHTTCNSKFGNISRYRGFPWVPIPENAR